MYCAAATVGAEEESLTGGFAELEELEEEALEEDEEELSSSSAESSLLSELSKKSEPISLSGSGMRLLSVEGVCEEERSVGLSLQAYRKASGVKRVIDSKNAVSFFAFLIINLTLVIHAITAALQKIECNTEEIEVL